MIRFLVVKEIPMNNFKHMTNAVGKEMRRSRDTDSIGFDEGVYMAKV